MSKVDRAVLVLAIVLVVDLLGVLACIASVQSQCLAQGYPSNDMSLNGQFYCTNQLTAVPLR